MIKKMLDTNICIYAMKNQPKEVAKKFSEYRRGEIAVSSITWAELYCGVRHEGRFVLDTLSEFLEIIPFCRRAAESYALLTSNNPNRKSGFDRMIAAHAIVVDVPLVTNNISDFLVYKGNGLIIENWVD